MFNELGFRGEALLTDQIRDGRGELQDLVVLAHDVTAAATALDTVGADAGLSPRASQRGVSRRSGPCDIGTGNRFPVRAGVVVVAVPVENEQRGVVFERRPAGVDNPVGQQPRHFAGMHGLCRLDLGDQIHGGRRCAPACRPSRRPDGHRGPTPARRRRRRHRRTGRAVSRVASARAIPWRPGPGTALRARRSPWRADRCSGPAARAHR